MKEKISVVIPFYNEAPSLKELYERITSVLTDLKAAYEIIFVNDGSIDGGDKIITDIVNADGKVKLINQRGNFGKAAALDAGFMEADGDYVITMDADLQDDPKEIPRFLEKLGEGYDLVSGWKFVRHDPFTRRFASKIFNNTLALFSGIKLHDFNCGFKAYRREVTQNIAVYGDLHRYIPVLAKWQGFNIAEIKVDHHPRMFGSSKYGLSRYLRGLLDLMTVMFLTRYLRRPLHFFGAVGIVFLALGTGISLYFVYLWLLGNPMYVRPMMVFGLVSVVVGMQFISLGFLGEMLVSSASRTMNSPIKSIICLRSNKDIRTTD